VVFRDLSAVTMRSCARLTSDKLTRCFGRSTAGRTTHGQCISGSGFLLHVGDYDAPNPKRTYVQFCTIKVSAPHFETRIPKGLAYRPPFFWPGCKFKDLKSLRYVAVDPPTVAVSCGRSRVQRFGTGECVFIMRGSVLPRTLVVKNDVEK